MTCQQFQHSPSLFGDCEAYGIWPTTHLMQYFYGLYVFFHACFWCARCLTNVNTITIFKLNLVYDSSRSLFLDLVFWLFKYARDGADRLMGDLDVGTSKTFCDSLGKSFGISKITKPRWLVSFISYCLLGWRPLWMKLAG